MAEQESPDALAKKIFVWTMVYAALYIGVVFAFILN